ncbi:hypothetical protein IWX76_002959 [Pedobacter sp. CAN_A7]|uniref:hypothetical protein n=1 Tax=Pedobacter sp. CAN_A7 TaxID=2787722 RepID=UPI0018C92A3D
MTIKESLLNGNSFIQLMKEFAVQAENIKIQDEEILFKVFPFYHRDCLKEYICIEGRNDQGVINFFGTLHYNLLNKLAVFEMQGFEKINQVC